MLIKSARGVQGFSLVEVLVAMGISSVLMLGVASMMVNSYKMVNNTRLSADINEADNLVALRLKVPGGCKAMFSEGATTSNAVVDKTWAGPTAGVAGTKDLNGANQGIALNTGLVLKNTVKYGTGITISNVSLSWDANSSLGSNSYFVTLNVSGSKTAGTFVGSQTFAKTYGVVLSKDPVTGKIGDCNGAQTQSDKSIYVVVAQSGNPDCLGSTGVEIQACLNKVAAGGTVLIKQGTYTGVTIASVPSRVKILGELGTVLTNSTNAPIFTLDKNSVAISGLSFDLNNNSNSSLAAIKVAASNIEISDNCFANDMTNFGARVAVKVVDAGGSRGLKILRNQFTGTCRNTSTVPVNEGYFKTTNNTGIVWIESAGTTDVHISENQFWIFGGDGIFVHGTTVGTVTSEPFEIRANAFMAAGTTLGGALVNAVHFAPDASNAWRIKMLPSIIGNRMANVDRGVWVETQWSKVLVENNRIECNPYTITNTTNDTWGIVGAFPNAASEYVELSVKSNDISNCKYGVIATSYNSTVLNNNVTMQYFRKSSIGITSVFGGLISGNSVDSYHHAVWIFVLTGGAVVSNNNFQRGPSGNVLDSDAPTCGNRAGKTMGICFVSVATCGGVLVNGNLFRGYSDGIHTGPNGSLNCIRTVNNVYNSDVLMLTHFQDDSPANIGNFIVPRD